MRVVANWLSSEMLAESKELNFSGITKIVSPYHLVQLNEKPKLDKNDYLICREVNNHQLSFVSTDRRGINSIVCSLINHQEKLKDDFNYLNINDFLNRAKSPRLEKVLDNLKFVERGFQEHFKTERLREYNVVLKNDLSFKRKSRKNKAAIKNGSYSLNFLLNKVKEIHSPDIFSILNEAKFVKKKEIFVVKADEVSAYLKIQEQFHLDSTLAKHLSIASTCDAVIVEQEQEFAHYSHILKAINSSTKVIKKEDFSDWYHKFYSKFPKTPTELVTQLLALIRQNRWEELNEELFILDIPNSFLGVFNYAQLTKDKEGKTLLLLQNKKGGLSESEKSFIHNFFNRNIFESASDEYVKWSIKNMNLFLNLENDGSLLVGF